MFDRLAEKFDLRVPRYTSYPTAPHFSAQVDGARYRDWLQALPAGQDLSLYIHVPFCDIMCWFCGCYTKVVRRYEPIARYLDLLTNELRLITAALAGRGVVRHLHWGGGSPTMLSPDDFARMMALLRDRFDVAADAEIAVEIDPRDATPASVAALAAAGVTRVSIGVQDFASDVQAAINRHQPFAVVEQVCRWLRDTGINRINFDLMYGLPHQTVAKVTAMVDQAVSLAPDRIALFGYAHVPWMKSHQRLIDESALPDGPERFRQSTAAAARLQDHRYRPVGLDHFARDDDALLAALQAGRLKRNFQGYTTDDAPVLIGFGASAIGALPQGYVQNAAPFKDYGEAIAAGRLPTARGVALSADDRLRRAVIERLMCELRVDLRATACDHPDAPADFAPELAALDACGEDGLVRIDGSEVIVTETGRPFVRLIASVFDRYLQQGVARHSRAV
jgi:oxygen-independent coproporphyrinogen-3 oxidase